MTDADYFTYQFYTWDYRGRGLFVATEPIQLEPPFIPFFRHRKHPSYIDDGKKHTLFSRFVEAVRGEAAPPTIDSAELDYETLEPFLYDSTERLGALHIHFPKERRIAAERMKALLIMLSSYDSSITSFEIIGNGKTTVIQFVATEAMLDIIETYTTAYFPEATAVYSDEYLQGIVQQRGYVSIQDVGLQQEFFRPIQTAKNFSLDPLLGIFAVLDKLREGEQGALQILFQSTLNTWTESIIHAATMYDGTSFFINDPAAPKIALEKVRSPLFAVSIRLIGQADDIATASYISERLSVALRVGSKGEHNQLIALPVDGYTFEMRLADVYLRESHRLGMLLNADELVSVLHFPSEQIVSATLFANRRKTILTPANALDKLFVLGENEHLGTVSEVTCDVQDRIRHTHIIGATGTGKSTLIANLILQDIENSFGVILFDPHGDLINDVIALTPPAYLDQIVLIDPSDPEYSTGLNILEAHSDLERELLASDLVAAFKRHSTSWGDQMSTVLGNAIEVLLASSKGGTIHDLRRFLIEKEVRQEYLATITDPTLLYYWNKEFQLSKGTAVGSIVTRLETFLRPRNIRNMLSQKQGINFEQLLKENKVILCKLSQGLLGKENSFLLSSLLLSHVHQTILRRQATAIRNPVFIYLDEFQNFIVPSVKEMLTGVRKYTVGLTLSHQNLNQVSSADSELLDTVLTNTSVRIAFRVGEPDAKQLKSIFTHFDSSDLQNLGNGEAIVSIEQPQYDCSVTTYPLPTIDEETKEFNSEYVLNHCRQVYARNKKDVEQELFDSLQNIKEEFKVSSVQKEPKQPVKPQPTPNIVERKHAAPVVVPNPEPLAKSEQTSVPSTHRYLQMLVKKMAESRGYIAMLEVQLPDGSGQVDVLLSKDNKTIAIEICNTTNAQWETHNILKCIDAKYDTVISLSGDQKQLENIKRKCVETIEDFSSKDIRFYTPDTLFSYLDQSVQQELPQEQVMKGYRVNVSYNTSEAAEANKKRSSVAQIVLNSLKKYKKQ